MEFAVTGHFDSRLEIGFAYMCGRIDCDRTAKFLGIAGAVTATTAAAIPILK